MIRVQIDEWLPEGVGCFDTMGPEPNSPEAPVASPHLQHRRTMLLQDFEQLDTTAVIAHLNGLARSALCQCGHEKTDHAGSSCRGCCQGGSFTWKIGRTSPATARNTSR